MTHQELILTLASALLHATWNFWLKGARDRPAVMFGSGYFFLVAGVPLLWLTGPLPALWGSAGLYVVLSALIHFAYRELLRLFKNRTITLDSEGLSVQRGPFALFRRRVVDTAEIARVITSTDGDGYAVEVLDTRGGRSVVIGELSPGPLPLLIARALETALGIEDHAPIKGEARPMVSGRLPDLGRMLHPLGSPASGSLPVVAGQGRVSKRDDVPQGVRVSRRGDALILRVSCSSVGTWLLFLFLPSLLWVAHRRLLLFREELPLLLLDALALAAISVSVYALAAMIINHTRLELTTATLSIGHKPLPWPGHRRLDLAMNSHLKTESHMGSKGTWSYSLYIFLRDGRRVSLIRYGPRAAVEWIEDALSAELTG